jgi:hypothetical protein
MVNYSMNGKNKKGNYMHDTTLDKAQRTAVKRMDNIARANSLPTYKELENRLYMALTAAHDALELGYTLTARLKDEAQEESGEE